MVAPVVVAYDEQEDEPVELDRWTRLAQDVLHHEGVPGGELTVLFVDEDAIAELNRDHLGHDGPTDVLSFPIDADAALGASGDVPPVLLGDIVICPAVARRSAAAHAGTYDDELALLIVHGVLHILGRDHAEPGAAVAMRAHERVLLEQHHWHGPSPASFRHPGS